MEVIKSTGTSHTSRYDKGEARTALLDMLDYLGMPLFLKLTRAVRDRQIKSKPQLYFLSSMAGVEGYPVECFIRWSSKLFSVKLKNK